KHIRPPRVLQQRQILATHALPILIRVLRIGPAIPPDGLDFVIGFARKIPPKKESARVASRRRINSEVKPNRVHFTHLHPPPGVQQKQVLHGALPFLLLWCRNKCRCRAISSKINKYRLPPL
ncbi:MAG TPA: hypothetical protein VN761_11590, partial [Candidatus Polarisedimenticolia bacterium]|nr:hypothetical protein [Candidatus Polarisedimenticolia bacterium]